jgi:hypothetical protein
MSVFIKLIFANEKGTSNYVHKRWYELYVVLRISCTVYFIFYFSNNLWLLHDCITPLVSVAHYWQCKR